MKWFIWKYSLDIKNVTNFYLLWLRFISEIKKKSIENYEHTLLYLPDSLEKIADDLKFPPTPPWYTCPWSNYFPLCLQISYFEFIQHYKAFTNNFVTHACVSKQYMFDQLGRSVCLLLSPAFSTWFIFANFVLSKNLFNCNLVIWTEPNWIWI